MHSRTWWVLGVGATVGAVAPPSVRAQDPTAAPAAACAPGARVQKVLITLVSDDTVMTGQRLPVRLRFPVESDLSAAPEASGAYWTLTLADPLRLDSLSLQPRLTGFRSETVAALRGDLRGGECVGRGAFRLTRVWRVEVASRPESIRVEERPVSTPSGTVRFTRFNSSEVAWSDLLSLRIFVDDDESVDHTVSRLAKPGETVLLNKHQIADLLCEKKNRCPNAFIRGLKIKRTKVDEISIRLLPP